jgi:ATP-dependent RNA helicase RhlE
MFSATFSDDIRQLAKTITRDPVEIDVAPRNSAVDIIEQTVYPVDKARKADLLSHLIRSQNWYQILVFSRTKHGADKLVKRLARDEINAAAIHGNKSQPQRTKALAAFKHNKIQVLVATDIAARGIDIEQLSHVINFDLPNVPEDYVHRIGRTGRAGASGAAISLVSADESKQLRDIERLLKRPIQRLVIEGYEPHERLAEASANQPPRHRQRPGNNSNPQNHRRGGNDHRGTAANRPASRPSGSRAARTHSRLGNSG